MNFEEIVKRGLVKKITKNMEVKNALIKLANIIDILKTLLSIPENDKK